MRRLPSVATLVLLLAFAPVAWGDDLVVEQSTLTKAENKLFQTIIKAYPSFHYSQQVRRYYKIHPEAKLKLPILVELVFPKKDGLYFGEFIGYSAILIPESSIIIYEYDAGTSNRGKATIMVTPKEVIKVERSCGVSACITQILKNGKKLFEQAHEHGQGNKPPQKPGS